MAYNYKVANCEELKQGAFDFTIKDSLHYIKVGGATVNQLKIAGILPKKSYGNLSNNKPDGIILNDKNDVIALIEYKRSGKIPTLDKAQSLVYEWYFALAEKVKCNVICITDGDNSYWFHAKTKNVITIESNGFLNYKLDVSKLTDNRMTVEEREELAKLISQFSTIDDYGNIAKEKILNPHELAKSVWQKIWISTGKEPKKCLYNVVEIFIFKFLSDLCILEDFMSFDSLFSLAERDRERALSRYASEIRPEIKKMFPPGQKDGTTIINGTIFVNEKGEANLSQAQLFYNVLKQFKEYGDKYGPFINIDKNFKTRLYESFLRQSAGVAALGQYFTPRNVVRAIVKMANGHNLPDNAKICDPFCGVGGFILEFINENSNFKNQYEPYNNEISPKCEIIGYDRGSDEHDDNRTIILAKANMLIYLSDFIAKHKRATQLFAVEVFNKTFHLIKSNLGTFGIDESDKYDLILTNPPYVTSGVSSIKSEIKAIGMDNIYPVTGNGLEGLSLPWIINSLKKGGTAFIILPDGVMNRTSDKKLRDYILSKCDLNCIVSLPNRTFFATPKQTYIISITKKSPNDGLQKSPVFTYLVSEIGETRDSKRFPINKNDLDDMAIGFKQFMVAKDEYKSLSPRCKIQDIDRFVNANSWMVDKDWSESEKSDLGLENEITEISEDDFIDKIKEIKDTVFNLYNSISNE